MALTPDLASGLGAVEGLDVLLDEPLAAHTSFRIGGPADALCTAHTRPALSAALRLAAGHHLPVIVLGRGTNVLVRDGGVRGLVLRLGDEFARVAVQGTMLTAGGAAPLEDVAWAACHAGLSGLQWAAGIPGSVAGAVVMNAGTTDGEMRDVVQDVDIITRDGTVCTLPRDALALGYRCSALQGRDDIVVRVRLVLQPGDAAAVQAHMERLLERREAKQPLDWPSAGSMFKRPAGDYAGRLIEAVGAKGLRVGDAQIAPQHANFVINLGHATAADVLALVARVREMVRAQFGVELEQEVQVVGEDTRTEQAVLR